MRILLISALAACAGACLAAAAANPEVKTGQNSLAVTRGETPVLEYKFTDVPFKPYVKKLCTPAGINVLRDAPHDHLHHHALMFALGVNGVSYWAETPKDGKQIHRSFTNPPLPGKVVAETLEWVDTAGNTALKEMRHINLLSPSHENCTLITWQSVLYLPEGVESVQLTGSHYYGLGMRFLESMDKDGLFFFGSDDNGEPVRGDERLTRAPWAAYTAEAEGKPVTVAMFNDPENMRSPAYWFTMHTPFAYLAATLNLHREPLKLQNGLGLPFRYGVAVWDGKQEKPTVENAYREWLQLIDE